MSKSFFLFLHPFFEGEFVELMSFFVVVDKEFHVLDFLIVRLSGTAFERGGVDGEGVVGRKEGAPVFVDIRFRENFLVQELHFFR